MHSAIMMALVVALHHHWFDRRRVGRHLLMRLGIRHVAHSRCGRLCAAGHAVHLRRRRHNKRAGNHCRADHRFQTFHFCLSHSSPPLWMEPKPKRTREHTVPAVLRRDHACLKNPARCCRSRRARDRSGGAAIPARASLSNVPAKATPHAMPIFAGTRTGTLPSPNAWRAKGIEHWSRMG